jgi:hypothetical protein
MSRVGERVVVTPLSVFFPLASVTHAVVLPPAPQTQPTVPPPAPAIVRAHTHAHAPRAACAPGFGFTVTPSTRKRPNKKGVYGTCTPCQSGARGGVTARRGAVRMRRLLCTLPACRPAAPTPPTPTCRRRCWCCWVACSVQSHSSTHTHTHTHTHTGFFSPGGTSACLSCGPGDGYRTPPAASSSRQCTCVPGYGGPGCTICPEGTFR